MSTREQKIRMKQERSLRRIQKRIEKDRRYIQVCGSDRGMSWARRRYLGRVHECEMGYGDCELRGYCNGDC